MQIGNVRYEYCTANERPKGMLPIPSSMEWHFDSPIHVGTFDDCVKRAHESNIHRDIMRNKGEGIDIDELAGSPVKVVVKRRVIIELPWDDFNYEG